MYYEDKEMAQLSMGTSGAISYTDVLNDLVYERTVREEYPLPAPLLTAEIAAAQYEFTNLASHTMVQPEYKEEYIKSLNEVQERLSALFVQNAQIVTSNNLIRTAVDDKYLQDINDCRAASATQGEALCICIDYQLRLTEWWMLPDNGLSANQKIIVSAWRLDMMSIPTTHPVVLDALARYNYLVENKPNYQINWGQ